MNDACSSNTCSLEFHTDPSAHAPLCCCMHAHIVDDEVQSWLHAYRKAGRQAGKAVDMNSMHAGSCGMYAALLSSVLPNTHHASMAFAVHGMHASMALHSSAKVALDVA